MTKTLHLILATEYRLWHSSLMNEIKITVIPVVDEAENTNSAAHWEDIWTCATTAHVIRKPWQPATIIVRRKAKKYFTAFRTAINCKEIAEKMKSLYTSYNDDGDGCFCPEAVRYQLFVVLKKCYAKQLISWMILQIFDWYY